MPTISATPIRLPRKRRLCDTCGWGMKEHVRLYGNADDPDPLHVLGICSACAAESRDLKVIAALDLLLAQEPKR